MHQATKWDVSFNEGILMQIKPKYINTLESFFKVSQECKITCLLQDKTNLEDDNLL